MNQPLQFYRDPNFLPVPLPQGRGALHAGSAPATGPAGTHAGAPLFQAHVVEPEDKGLTVEDPGQGPDINFAAIAAGGVLGYLLGKGTGAAMGAAAAYYLSKRQAERGYLMPDQSVAYGATFGDACSRWQRKYERYSSKGGKRRDKWADKNYSKAAAAGCAWTQPESVQQVLQGGSPDVSAYSSQGYSETMAAGGGTGVMGGNALSPILLVGGLGLVAVGLVYVFTRKR